MSWRGRLGRQEGDRLTGQTAEEGQISWRGRVGRQGDGGVQTDWTDSLGETDIMERQVRTAGGGQTDGKES